MANRQTAHKYLKSKFQDWGAISGRLENYVNPRGRKQLVRELQSDAAIIKRDVCPYIKEAGYIQFRSLVVQAAEGLIGWLFGVGLINPSTLDIILGALMDVCGYRKVGDQLIERGV